MSDEIVTDIHDPTYLRHTFNEWIGFVGQHRPVQRNATLINRDLDGAGMGNNATEFGPNAVMDDRIVGLRRREWTLRCRGKSASVIREIATGSRGRISGDVRRMPDFVGQDPSSSPAARRVEQVHGRSTHARSEQDWKQLRTAIGDSSRTHVVDPVIRSI
jgi:hypothetical protein